MPGDLDASPFQAAGLCFEVTALELRDGRYVEAGRVVGDEVLALELPFPVPLCPQALLG